MAGMLAEVRLRGEGNPAEDVFARPEAKYRAMAARACCVFSPWRKRRRR
jgi:hypothetical protein